MKATRRAEQAGELAFQSNRVLAQIEEILVETGPEFQLSKNLDVNLRQLEEIFKNANDVVFRQFEVTWPSPVRGLAVYIDGMVDKALLDQHVLRPLIQGPSPGTLPPAVAPSQPSDGSGGPAPQSGGPGPAGAYDRPELDDFLQVLVRRVLTFSEVDIILEWRLVIKALLEGDTIILFEGRSQALSFDTRGFKSREVSEPTAESVIRGPREGMVETIRINITLVRRRIRSPNLKVKMIQIGQESVTDVAIMYIEGVARKELVQEVERRLEHIQIDGILESGYLEELIEDHPYSPFPQIQNTERPDRVAASLLEGRVAILTDGTPMALLVPTMFWQFLQASEDYYERYPVATLLRFIRFLAINVSLLLPSLYVAAISFHQEMVPTPLLLTIAASREGIPFPAFIEALSVEIVFEVLREAGVRLPRPVGQAISIVGALVIGEAAVRAGLISPLMVIVVAFTAIASFATPTFSSAITIRLLRFPMIFLAGALGLYGIILGLIAIQIHLSSMKSFGEPYLAPYAPLGNLRDIFVRAPWWSMLTRPRVARTHDEVRQPVGLKPEFAEPKAP